MDKQKGGILKRLWILYGVVQNYQSLESYNHWVKVCDGIGTFHNAPVPDETGGSSASYTSSLACRELLVALAGATRMFWKSKTLASPRHSLASDETSEVDKHAQHCMIYKIVFAGLHRLSPTTAVFLKATLFYQLDKDGIDKKKQLNVVCFDTCAVMFGIHQGVAALIGTKCNNSNVCQSFSCSCRKTCPRNACFP